MRCTPVLLLAATPWLVASCGGDASSGPAADVADVGTDVGPIDGTGPPATCPADHVTLTFTVDDSANQTYTAGELTWTGSFAWDEAQNILVYATSWLPEEGPYPLLHDDGPRSDGGHEPEGGVAGDHVFGVAVCYLADQHRTFAYGVLNGDMRWIWSGPNGVLEVPAAATGTMEAPGLVIGAHGDRDFRIFLDLTSLHGDYAGVTADSHRIYIKGTMNSWTPVQLLDDGNLGDAISGDGVLSYEHGLFLGPHDGLLSSGQEAQFVFVFAVGETDPDDGLEYKVEGDAALEGISATGECGSGWEPMDVVQALDSKGVVQNAAITMCTDDIEPECDALNPCPDANSSCIEGVCVPDVKPAPEIWLVVPDSGTTAGGTDVSIQGTGFVVGAVVTFGGESADVIQVTPEEIVATTPPHGAGAVDVEVFLPDESSALFYGGFTYTDEVDPPGDVALTGIGPNTISPLGGAHVSVQGIGLEEACNATLDGAPLEGWTLADGVITFVAPVHVPGAVEFAVQCPEGDDATTLTYAHAYDGAMGEWPDDTLVATNTTATDWGPDNLLGGLYAATDGESLYVGIAGKAMGGGFGPNAIAVYVDTDFGASTGVSGTGDITDDDGAVDAALGGVLTLTLEGFGAEVAFATLDMATYTPDGGDPSSVAAGWRGLDPADDLPWLLEGLVVSGPDGVEASLPLAALYPGDPSGVDHTLAITARIVNQDGSSVSNQALPGGTDGDGNTQAAVLELVY